MRDIGEAVKAKEEQLQGLEREMNKVRSQLETLHSAMKMLEEEDDASPQQSNGEPVTFERRPVAAVTAERPAATASQSKQFP